MRGIGSPVTIIDGVPVITAPAEIDVATAGQLRLALMQAASGGHATIVVDLTGTRFCDSTGLDVLVRAHQWALTDGGELRLALPAGGAAFRVFTLTGLDRVIPRFDTLDQALLPRPAAVIVPLTPRRSPGVSRPPARPAARVREREPVAGGMLEVWVAAGASGPVIMLCGETGPGCKAQLSALLAGQLAGGGARHLTVDVSGLRSADPAGLRALVLAAVLLQDRGGSLVLLRPQEPVARALALTGAGHMFTIRGGAPGQPDPQDGETGPG